ncbi:MAG TPA: hypothetical protein VEC99_02890 [Clostridia bacterium]|nr:hypothetical protein [Clostridia bacterium]
MKIRTMWTALGLAGCFAFGWIAHDLAKQPTPRRVQRVSSVNRVYSVSVPLTNAPPSVEQKPSL